MNSTPQSSLRYAVLWHSGITEPHFDLLVETRPGSELATWRSPAWPIEKPTLLTRVKDHRRIYLDYEGDLTERRGMVERVGGGTCTVTIGESAVWELNLGGTMLTLAQKNQTEWSAEIKSRPRAD